MPKYLKDTKIEYWKETDGGVSNEGIPLDGVKTKVADLWANAKGKDMTQHYVNSIWPAPVWEFVLTRPSFEINLSDHIKHNGKFYKIANIDELTGRPHSDIKIHCEHDATFTIP